MNKNTIKTGEVYRVKVTGKLTDVRIIGGNPRGGWDSLNLATNKHIHIKSGARLRKPVSDKAKEPAADTTTPETATQPKPGGLNAAIRVLQEAGTPINCQQMVKEMLEKGYWKTGGRTPVATIYSAITREIKEKGADARFRKTERGKFALAK